MTWLLAGFAWVGHACLWTFLLNFAYAQPLSKRILRPFRLLCGVAIAGFPAVIWLRADVSLWPYLAVCLVLGVAVFPALTMLRLLRRPPAALLRETLDEEKTTDQNLTALAEATVNDEADEENEEGDEEEEGEDEESEEEGDEDEEEDEEPAAKQKSVAKSPARVGSKR